MDPALLSEYAATPWAVVGLPLACLAWWMLGLDTEGLLAVLSVVALTLSQLILVAGKRSERTILAALKELVRVNPEARDDVLDQESS